MLKSETLPTYWLTHRLTRVKSRDASASKNTTSFVENMFLWNTLNFRFILNIFHWFCWIGCLFTNLLIHSRIKLVLQAWGWTSTGVENNSLFVSANFCPLSSIVDGGPGPPVSQKWNWAALSFSSHHFKAGTNNPIYFHANRT